MAKIKHIAMICMDPNKLADFYCDVFDMKVQLRRNGNVFLTDGYLNVALLAQTAEGKPNGLNHFGFHIENADVVTERMKKWNVVGPVKRPADRTYAETRGTDPEGNNFDLTVGGFERSRQPDVVELQRQTEPTPA
jgi:catechol 2,3-dioxygenase-like lactoylglutathione lyase family enzyme